VMEKQLSALVIPMDQTSETLTTES
jgi:hypothetical protein